MPAKRRGPRAALLVLITAAAAAVTVALLGFKTASTVPAGIPHAADLVTVTGTPVGRPVPAGFVGLSIEQTTLGEYAGSDPRHVNPLFVTLLRQLAPHGRPSLRLGGDSSDWGWFKTPHLKHFRGLRFTLGSNWVNVARSAIRAAGGTLILGLDLEANNRRLFAYEAKRMAAIGAGNIGAFEVGNEPEVFGTIGWYYTGPHLSHPVRARPRSYNFASYGREFSDFARLIPGQFPLAGPSSGGPRWIARAGLFAAQHPRARLVTIHLYPLHNCLTNPSGPFTPTLAHITAASASVGAASALGPLAAAVHSHGAQLRIDELNSVSCAGAPGISDRFVSTLWALDTLFALARQGIDGVNIHTFAHAYYRTFYFTHTAAGWRAFIAPLYYGLYAFAHAAPPGSQLLQTSTPSSPDLRVWATRAPDKRVRVVLINKSATAAHTIAIKLPAAAARYRLTLQRLAAPSLTAPTGVTLGGQSFSPASGHLVGVRQRSFPPVVRGGIYLLRVPAASAAILTR